VISATDGSGTLVGINAYDEYGRPAASNTGRMQYTGQLWLPEANLYYYKARMYDAKGRFVQTDPIGIAGGINLYAYTGNNPVNVVDPLGLCSGNEVRLKAGGYTSFDPHDPNGPVEVVVVFICIDLSTAAGSPIRSTTPSQFFDVLAGGEPAKPDNPPAPSPPRPQPKPQPKPNPSEVCTAINGGLVTYGSKELVEVGAKALRGTTPLKIILDVGATEAASDVILGVAIAGGTIYAVDTLSGGAVTRTVGGLLRC